MYNITYVTTGWATLSDESYLKDHHWLLILCKQNVVAKTESCKNLKCK